MTNTPTPTLARKASRNRSRSCREEQAKEHFQNAWETILEAQKRGLWRIQLKQDHPVTYEGTKAGREFQHKLHELGLKSGWSARTFEATHPNNPFYQHVFIKELRVWWHDAEEKLNPHSSPEPLEGSEEQDSGVYTPKGAPMAQPD